MTGFAPKVLKSRRALLMKRISLTQRRKGAKKAFRNVVALCGFAPLRERSLGIRYFLCKAKMTLSFPDLFFLLLTCSLGLCSFLVGV